METLPDNPGAAGSFSIVSSTDASHSPIGHTTIVDYNLASIHKNAVLLVDNSVGVIDQVLGVGPVLLLQPSDNLLGSREVEQDVLDVIDAPPTR